MRKWEYRIQANTVMEMALIMPVVVLSLLLSVFAIFYYHDKAVLAGAAYEAVVYGSEMSHEEKQVSADKIVIFFDERISGKMIYFGDAKAVVSVGKEEIKVSAQAVGRRMHVAVERSARISDPEKEIRRKAGMEKVEEIIK